MSTSNKSSITFNNDDNEEILNLLKDRLKLGRERYGHGVRVNDDTTQWGTQSNDWELMAIEEVLDGLIYSAAAIIRLRRIKNINNTDISNSDISNSDISNSDINNSDISNSDINKINNNTAFPFYM
jgi:uncharacterized protein YjbI with pentapeptide repeats